MEKISRPAWILCNPRCGSSYLCELLNNTGRFETVHKNRAFGEWLKLYKTIEDFQQNPPKFNKCTHHQFRLLFGDAKRGEMEAVLPGIRYIVMHRRDLFAQTVSLYIAKQTDRYHLFSKEALDEYTNQTVEFDEELILKMYKNACGYPTVWHDFLNGVELLEIYYEDLMADPATTLSTVGKYLQLELSDEEVQASASKHRLIPTTRPEAAEFIKRLKQLVS